MIKISILYSRHSNPSLACQFVPPLCECVYVCMCHLCLQFSLTIILHTSHTLLNPIIMTRFTPVCPVNQCFSFIDLTNCTDQPRHPPSLHWAPIGNQTVPSIGTAAPHRSPCIPVILHHLLPSLPQCALLRLCPFVAFPK